jgi:MFS family permease
MQNDFKATAIPVSAATLMSMLGVGMMVPALPHLAAESGSTGVAAGALIGAYGLSRLIFNTPSGFLIDQLGIAKSAVIGLLALAAVSMGGFFAKSFAALFLVMALLGAASSLFSTAAMTALILKAGPQGRGRALAWFQTSLLLGFAIGPVIGGQLVDRFNAHAPFPTQAVIALLALLAVRAMPMTQPPTRNVAARSGLGSLIGPALIVGGLGGFAAFFCRFGVAWNLVPLAALQEFQLSTSELGWLIGAGTIANVVVAPFLGRLIDGWGAKATFVTACLLNLAGMLILFAAPSVVMLWISTAVVMLATGIMLPAAGAIALNKTKPQVMGRTMGLYRTVAESGMALGPVMVPAITAAGKWPVLYGLLTCAMVTALALAAAAVFVGRREPVIVQA